MVTSKGVWLINCEVTEVLSTGDSEAGKIKLEEAQTRGRSTNAGEPNLIGGGKEEKNESRNTKELIMTRLKQ